VALEVIVSSSPAQPGNPGDDELLAQLRDIAAENDPVPEPPLLDAARVAFELRDLDAMLAELVHDSAVDAPQWPSGAAAPSGFCRSRSGRSPSSARAPRGSHRDLLGQLVGGRAEEMDVQVTGAITTVPVNDAGWFSVRGLPAGSFRLRSRLADRTRLVISWAAP
jgi:hypothetical protein